MNLGKSVKIALAMKGMKQMELAKMIGYSPRRLSRICNQDQFGMGNAQLIAEALDMKVSELVALGEDKA
jgi:transcriptional regulator with XRE-family HTH domain